MKTRITIAACILALTFTGVSPAVANDEGFEMVADTVVVRPACLVATIIGSVFFVVSLPISAISGSVKKSANTLVVRPAQATFTRPLGDMDALLDY